MIPASYSLLQEMEKEEKFSSFYKASAIFISTLDKFSTKKKVQADFTNKYTCKNPKLKEINKLNLIMWKN